MVSHSVTVKKWGDSGSTGLLETALGLFGARGPGGAVCYTATMSGWACWLVHDVFGGC